MDYTLLKQKSLKNIQEKARKKAYKMQKAGMSLREIGKVLGVSYEQVRILTKKVFHRNTSKAFDKVSTKE